MGLVHDLFVSHCSLYTLLTNFMCHGFDCQLDFHVSLLAHISLLDLYDQFNMYKTKLFTPVLPT